MTVLAVLVVGAVLLWPSARAGGVPGSGVRWSAVAARLRRRPAPGADAPWVADLAEVTAVGLEAGLDLPGAVLAAARSPTVRGTAPWVEGRVVEALCEGRPVSSCLDALPGGPVGGGTSGPARGGPHGTAADLALLVAAWRLAEEVGAPAAGVTGAAAEAVREGRASRERAEVVVAGPRTSMWLLTALPLLGPVGGALVGLGPDRLYASGAARVAALTGVLLTAAGWWWARTVLARAARPGTTGDPAALPVVEPGGRRR